MTGGSRRLASGDSVFPLSCLLLLHRIVETVGPAGLDRLFGAYQPQLAIIDIVRHRTSRANHRVRAAPYRGDQHAVRSDESPRPYFCAGFDITPHVSWYRTH